jgi:hypothetical protein
MAGRKLPIKDVKLSANLAASAIQFGDTVRVKSSPITEDRGFAGKVGTVWGQTTPSQTKPEVIGTPEKDYAVNVYFDDFEEQHWFAEELLELVDHGAGATVQLKGVPTTWVRKPDGSWAEIEN